jgi:hypothetical protein
MATTTNYGWTTPDNTDLVKDGASAIRTLGSSVDTTTKALNPSTTLGDIEYRSATANTNTRLAIGSTGNVLTVAGGVPTWAAPAGGGKVLQVVQAEYSTSTTIASTSYTDTGLTATITPSATSSKILVFVNQHSYIARGSSNTQGCGLKIVRGATSIFEVINPNARFLSGNGLSEVYNAGIDAMTYLDNPATTSATTYKIQARVETTAQSGVYYAQASSAKSVITLLEIGA